MFAKLINFHSIFTIEISPCWSIIENCLAGCLILIYFVNMNNRSPEIIALCSEIEESVGRRMKTPSHYDFLSGVIWERIGAYISPTTLKRTWGYINGANTIRNSTLQILAKIAGYRDWDTYIKEYTNRSGEESELVQSNVVNALMLNEGDSIEVAWNPNRYCEFRHLGGGRFEVIKSANSKLRVGNTFNATYFIEGEPLYLDRLCQGTKIVGGYLCGNKNGLTYVKVVKA